MSTHLSNIRMLQQANLALITRKTRFFFKISDPDPDPDPEFFVSETSDTDPGKSDSYRALARIRR